MPTSREQRQAEFELIRRFFRLADAQGLPIPEDNQTLRRALPPDGQWPPPEMYALVAVAQHYGVPTRMLDWTRKPLIAAYFAAIGAARAVSEEKKDVSEHLTVWAMRRRIGGRLVHSSVIEFVFAPRASNPNMHLQSGLFSLHVDDGLKLEQPPGLRTIGELIRSPDATDGAFPVLRELRLPLKEAGRLLGLLRDRFVQAATVYAGYEGIKQSVFETRYRS